MSTRSYEAWEQHGYEQAPAGVEVEPGEQNRKRITPRKNGAGTRRSGLSRTTGRCHSRPEHAGGSGWPSRGANGQQTRQGKAAPADLLAERGR